MAKKSFFAFYFGLVTVSLALLVVLTWFTTRTMSKNTDLETQLDLAQSQLDAARSAVRRLESHQSSQTLLLESKEKEAEDLNVRYLRALAGSDRLEKERTVHLSRIRDLVKSRKDLEAKDKENLRAAESKLNETHAKELSDLKDKTRREKELLVSEVNKQMANQKAFEEAALKAAREESGKEIQVLKEELEKIDPQIRQYRQTVASLEKQLKASENAQKENQTLKTQALEYKENILKLERQIKLNSDAVKGMSALKKKAAEAKSEAQRLIVENKDLKEKLSSLGNAVGLSRAANRMSASAPKASGGNFEKPGSENDSLRLEADRTHYNLGVLYLERGDTEGAMREFQHSIYLNPNDALAHYNLAFIYDSELKDFESAIDHYKTYLRLMPDAKDRNEVEAQLLRLRLRKEVGVEGVLRVSK